LVSVLRLIEESSTFCVTFQDWMQQGATALAATLWPGGLSFSLRSPTRWSVPPFHHRRDIQRVSSGRHRAAPAAGACEPPVIDFADYFAIALIRDTHCCN